MKPHRAFLLATKTYGSIISALLLLIIGMELAGLVSEKGLEGLEETGHYLVNWHDNPTVFFSAYFLGYITVWWKKRAGAMIILAACIVATWVNRDNPGWFIFTGPTFLVGLLYLIYTLLAEKS